jgi:TolB-like protein/Tfp pilus assembly protein PilF
LVILIVGFIIAVILSWIYDVHPEGGIVKTEPAQKVKTEDVPKSSNSWRIASYISFVVIIGLLAINIFGNRNQTKLDESLEKSIAVLPFLNLSGDPSQDFICDGLTGEIISHLYKIESFGRVPSLNSVLRYKGTVKSTVEISNELGVNYILECSYKKLEGLLRFTVLMKESRSDKLIWTYDFDKQSEEISSIPSDIALQIADQLEAFLTDPEKQIIQRITTSNQEAYIKYNQGKSYFRRGRNEQDLNTALNLYKESIALDPGYALAYTALARCYMNLYWFRYDHSQLPLIESKKAIETALRIDPGLPEAYIAKAEYYYHGLLEYSNALEQLQIASTYVSNHSEISLLSALVYRRMGKWNAAIEEFENAYKGDPTSLRILGNMGETYAFTGKYQIGIDYFDKYLMIEPDNAEGYSTKLHLYLMMDGNTMKTRKVIEEAAMNNISPYVISIDALYTPPFMLDVYDGNYQKALNFLSTTDWAGHIDLMKHNPKTLFQAMIYTLMNLPDKAVAYYDSMRIVLEMNLKEYPEDPRILSSLGIAHAGLGEKEVAINYGKEAVDLYSLEKDALIGLSRIEELALVYVMVEEYDAALEQIEILLSNPGPYSAPLLKLDPRWKPLWDHPEFIRLMEKYAEK